MSATTYPAIDEQCVLTDWYAGAWAEGSVIEDWHSCDTAIAFSEIGVSGGDGHVHGQLVIYGSSSGYQRALSAEINVRDATAIIAVLARFVAGALAEEGD